jgi:hypothetical protein
MGEAVTETNAWRLDPAKVGLVLVAAPGVGYVIAYARELGYALQFQIPSELIAPQLGDVLATTGVFIAIASLGAFGADVYLSGRGDLPITPVEWLLALLEVLGLLLLLASGGDPSQVGATWFAVGILVVAPVLALVIRAGIVRGRNWGRLQVRDTRVSRDSPIVRVLIGMLGRFWFFVVLAFIAITWTSFALGGFQARNQTEFLVLDGPIPEVELAIYGDTVVLAPFDQSKHLVRTEFDIVKIGPTPLHLRLMDVGPLKKPA